MVSIVTACSVAWAKAEPTAAPVSEYRITGVLVSSVDEAPVAHAHLNATATMERAGRQFFPRAGLSNGIEADTDERGRFVLTVPSAGKWRLTASATGFVTQAYEEHDGFSSAVVLTSTNPTIYLHFRLPPEAEIAGTVFDDASEAVRDARVTLQYRAASTPNREQQTFQNRATVQTDDRGVFEFAGLAAGDYRILVDAKPWYSTTSQPRVPSNTIATDSRLDVTYQLTWYPGADDPTQAETLSLHPADRRRADFHLVPIPAVHLQLNVPASSDPVSGRPLPFFPVLERVDISENGSGLAQSALGRAGSRGQVDIGGLAPGLYRIRFPGPDRGAETKLIEIAPGASRVVDTGTVSVEVANVVVEVDNGSEERPLGIELRNTESGRRFTPGDTNMFMPGRLGRESQPKVQRKLSLQVPPGRYEVGITNRDVSLVKISAKGAEVSGRFNGACRRRHPESVHGPGTCDCKRHRGRKRKTRGGGNGPFGSCRPGRSRLFHSSRARSDEYRWKLRPERHRPRTIHIDCD